MSTFFWCIIDFIFETDFYKFLLLPVPFYCMALLYRVFYFRGD